jgi:2-deoxy-D-gluconate 3-dehydrogenase
MAPSHTELFSLEGRTALCTGVTISIGAQMAIALAGAGAEILLVQA